MQLSRLATLDPQQAGDDDVDPVRRLSVVHHLITEVHVHQLCMTLKHPRKGNKCAVFVLTAKLCMLLTPHKYNQISVSGLRVCLQRTPMHRDKLSDTIKLVPIKGMMRLVQVLLLVLWHCDNLTLGMCVDQKSEILASNINRACL